MRASRRQTLGAMSINEFRNNDRGGSRPIRRSKARQSMAPRVGGGGRVSLAPARRGGGGRLRENRRASVGNYRSSLGVGRRQSLYGSMHTEMKKECRPIGDKKYTEECANILITYLATHQYEHPVNKKQVLRPTNRDFHNIVHFLFRKLDVNYQNGRSMTEMTKEVPLMFKGISYPFSISKTALSAVGTPHTWPALLAALTWLVELLSYDDAVSLAEENETDKTEVDYEQKSARIFFKYLGKAYKAFLAGDDAMEESLLQDLILDKENRNKAIQMKIDDSVEKQQELTAEKTTLENSGSALPALHAKQADYTNDLQKFQMLIQKLDDHAVTMKKKLAHRREDCEAKSKQLIECQERQAQLQAEVDAQELSAKDVEQMKQNRAHLKAELQRVVSSKEAMQKEVWELEIMKKLEETLRPYHSAARSIGLVPSTAKYARGEDYELQLRANYDPEAHLGQSDLVDGLLSFDVKAVLKPRLQELRSEFIAKGHRLHAEYLRAKETLDNTEDLLRAEKEAVAELNFELERKEKTLDKEIGRERRMYAAETKRAQDIEDELEYIIGCAQQEERLVTVCGKLKETLEYTKEDHIRALKQISEQLVGSLTVVADHKQVVQGTISHTLAELQSRVLCMFYIFFNFEFILRTKFCT